MVWAVEMVPELVVLALTGMLALTTVVQEGGNILVLHWYHIRKYVWEDKR